MKRIGLVVLTVLFTSMALLTGCRVREVGNVVSDWLLLAEDPDDGTVAYNAHNLYVDADFTDLQLDFKMEPYSTIPNAADDVLFTIFFDTDQDNTTGLNSTTPGWDTDAAPQSIGADFMMFIGSEEGSGGQINTNEVYTWNSTDTAWDLQDTALSVYQPANADSVKGGILEASLGNPSAIDVEVIFICDVAASGEYRDRVPNSGHVTIDLANDTIIPASVMIADMMPSVSLESSRAVSLITGKPRKTLRR